MTGRGNRVKLHGLGKCFGVLLCLSVFILAIITTPSADILEEVSRVKIMLGRGDSMIGLEEGGGEHWKPLFFSRR